MNSLDLTNRKQAYRSLVTRNYLDPSLIFITSLIIYRAVGFSWKTGINITPIYMDKSGYSVMIQTGSGSGERIVGYCLHLRQSYGYLSRVQDQLPELINRIATTHDVD